MDILNRIESNVRYYSRLFPTVFVTAQGSELTDDRGRKYIDFLSGGGALNYGHNDPGMKKAIIDFISKDGIIHSLDMITRSKTDFLDTFESLILKPRHLDYKIQFTGPTGTNGVEAALKLARLSKKRANIIAFSNGFHGITLGALATTANTFYRNEYYVNRQNVSFMPYDGYLGDSVNTAEYLRKVLADPGSGVDLPAAILLETIQAEGGVNVAESQWLKDLEQICREFDILLILDDIQTGVGRTGPFFSFEDAGLYPDIIVLSKSLSGFGLPISLVLLKPELDQWSPGEHTGTFRGNNLAFVAATEALKNFWQDNSLTDAVIRKGKIISNMLEGIIAQYKPEIEAATGKGMLHGLKISSPETARNIISTAFEQGLIMEPCGPNADVIKISPPLTITNDLLNHGLEILQKSITVTVAGSPPAGTTGIPE